MKKIGFISETDPFSDRIYWSGTNYKLREALEMAGYVVVWIPYDPLFRKYSFQNVINTLYWKIRRRIFHRDPLVGIYSKSDARRFAQSIDVEKIMNCDYLFFPNNGIIGVYLDTTVPVIYLSDATAYIMIDYYWHNKDKRALQIAKVLDEKASQKSMINIRSSQWAINSVINDCKCDKNRCFVLEFGPGIDAKDIAPNPYYKSGRLNIMFSGIDWERKGGDLAVETVGLLREKGLDARLTIAGPDKLPQKYHETEFIDYVGFLDKNNKEEYKKYIELYRKSHLLLLPTKAECSAIVYCEAAAFGIPCYTFSTGGTANYVINDYNGASFPVGSNAKDFADRIFNDIKQGRMKIYSDNAQTFYKENLSWEIWTKRFKAIMDEVDA